MKRLAVALTCLLCLSAVLPARAQSDFVVRHGDETLPRIAITMDDCYSAENVGKALALCQEFKVPMTFFILGDALHEEDGEMWRGILDAGCEIGNHSFGHPNLGDLTVRQVDNQMRRTQKRLDEVLGYHYPMQVMRPPFGSLSGEQLTKTRVLEALRHAGLQRAVLWNVSQTNPEKARPQVRNGSILLYHANRADVTGLAILIPQLLSDGFELCTVSDLLGIPPLATSTDLYTYDPRAPW